MQVAQQIAKHLREVFSGDNWTSVNMQETLDGVTWQAATTKFNDFNTIASLVFHINYYVTAALGVLKGAPLTAKDIYSFDHPPISTEEQWQQLLRETRAEAEHLASLIEQLPDAKLAETFAADEYGNFYRNLHGIIEHAYYHLGQIVLLKKLLRQPVPATNSTGGI